MFQPHGLLVHTTNSRLDVLHRIYGLNTPSAPAVGPCPPCLCELQYERHAHRPRGETRGPCDWHCSRTERPSEDQNEPRSHTEQLELNVTGRAESGGQGSGSQHAKPAGGDTATYEAEVHAHPILLLYLALLCRGCQSTCSPPGTQDVAKMAKRVATFRKHSGAIKATES